MIARPLAGIAALLAADVVPQSAATTHIDGAAADSRRVSVGDLFVAIPGERVDGYEFCAQAAAAGAVAALATRPSPHLPTVVVADPVTALGRLASAVVGELADLTVVGVTGSSGKTTTKDLLAVIMADRGAVVAPAGSFNTEVGLPLTALQCDDTTRTLVAEMGARGPGHIATLCQITPPQISVVLNVGTAHLGEFGSREVIAATKGEIVESLPSSGHAVLNADDPLVAAMADRTSASVVTFGTAAGADLRIGDLTLDESARPSFTLVRPDGESVAVRLHLSGAHNAHNAAAAALAGLVAGLSLEQVGAALNRAEPASRWRMEVSQTPAGVTIVNDAYNANPDSMTQALKALAEMGRQRRARTFAVLGEMKELGDESVAQHDAIGRLAVRLNISRLVAVGEGARPISLGAAHEGSWNGEAGYAADLAAAAALLHAEVAPGDIVLIKGSRSVGLEALAEQLQDPPT